MHKIDAPGHDNNEFTEGDPVLAVPATTVGAKWLTSVQREIVAVIEDAGITLDDSIDTQLLQAIGQLGGGGGARNLCGNPHFDLWTRWGTAYVTHVAPGDYALDRWWVRPDDAGGSGTGRTRQEQYVLGVAGFDGGHPRYRLEYEQLVNPTIASGWSVGQYIYEIDQFKSETVTWSIWAGSQDGSPLDIIMRVVMHYGTGGSPSADEIVVTSSKTINSSAKIEVTGTFASFFGKTLGSNGDAHVTLEIIADGTTESGIEITQSQLEFGTSSSTFAKPAPSVVIHECLRHWQTSYRPGDRGGTAKFDGEYSTNKTVNDTSLIEVDVRLVPEMRVIPAIRWYDPASGTIDRISVGGTSRTVSGEQVASEKSIGKPTITVASSGSIIGQYTCDAEATIA